MTNFEAITESPEALAEFLDSLNIESGSQATWQESLGDCALPWLLREC